MKNYRVCKKCNGFSSWNSYFQSWICTQCGDIVIETNADRIRNMSDEELDKFLGEVQWDVANYCGGKTEEQEYPVPKQQGAWLDWLKQEVKNK